MIPPFDSLSDADAFEELCFDLLNAEGFDDLTWRGPGPDGGRDIEATWKTQDPTGGAYQTRWYVECKWYSDSVPFQEIEPKLLAATAARVDFLLIATSSRVRNTAMNSIAEWLSHRGNPFRVRYWTGRDLLSLAIRHSDVFKRHFPTQTPPSWGDQQAALQRFRQLVDSSGDRLTWRVVPALQWVTASLLTSRAEGTSPEAETLSELDILACSLRAHELFAQTSIPAPAKHEEDISACINLVVNCVERRVGAKLIVTLPGSCVARVARPMLVTALFELMLNALQYADGGQAAVSLTSSGHHWLVEIRNPSTESRALDWPVLGVRGAIGLTRNASGQGLGCWLAFHAGVAGGFSVAWKREGGDWVVQLRGALT